MIQSAKEIDWSAVDSYSMDHRLGILDHIVVAGIKYNLGHLNIRAEDVSYYMGHQPLSGAVQRDYQPNTQQIPQYNQNQNQQQPQEQPQPNRRSGFGGIDNAMQRSVAMFIVAVGGFAMFAVFLFKRLIVNKMGLAITDGFSDVKGLWSKTFGDLGESLFPNIAGKDATVFDQGSIIIAFALLFLPVAYQIIRAPSKILVTTISYILSLVLIAFLYTLGVSNDFLGVMGSFPPLLSINPLSLFGYISK